jgi:4-amino-4-deoxy-L-arabinose transferase-like glycosyltransferase
VTALLLAGAVTAVRFHVWSKVDERAHFDYVQTVADHQRLPVLTDPISPTVRAVTTNETTGLGAVAYESFQPPLYYLLAAPASRLAHDPRTRVKAVRLFDLALLLVATALLWPLARRVAPRAPPVAFAAGLAVLLWPGLVARAVCVSPTSLELVTLLALLNVLCRVRDGGGRRWVLAAGALTGACVLTKTTLVYVVPVVLAVLALDWRARRDTRGLIAALVLPLILVAPWVAFNVHHYGTLTADTQAQAQQHGAVNPGGHDFVLGDVWTFTRRLPDEVIPAELNARLLGRWWIRAATIGLVVTLLLTAVALARRRGTWMLWVPLVTGYVLLAGVMVVQDWPTLRLRYLFAALPAVAVGAAGTLSERTVRWVVLACTLVAGALWIEVAANAYFTDLGARLGL